MPDCNENKNPLLRSGTSQLQRQLSGLEKDYVRIDEKEYDNWIIFATQFSHYLKYYDATDTAAGDWTIFFTNDVSAILGSIAVQQVEVYRQSIKVRIDFLKNLENDLLKTDLKRNLSELFCAIFTLAKALDGYLVKIAVYNNNSKLSGNTEHQLALQTTLESLVKSKLAPALRRFIGYYKAASDPALKLNYIIPGGLEDWQILNTPVTQSSTILEGDGLSKSWWIFPPSVPQADRNWSKYIEIIPNDVSIFLTPALPTTLVAADGVLPGRIFQRINHAANHNLFTGIFDQFLTGYTRIIQEAEKELLTTMEDWDSHAPHYALFLSFLKLFRFAQTHINNFTQLHLDHYYKEILQLFPREAEPNQAHILVELAKQVDDYLLAKDTLFKAGKDSTGKEVLYAMDDDDTFNKASIASFKSVYIGSTSDNHPFSSAPAAPIVNNNGRIFASPVANSGDGAGAELTTDNQEWHPYVNKIYSEAKLVDIAMPNAEIGFALASHYLYLSEGTRKVRIKLLTDNSTVVNALDSHINCFLTTEKEWFQVPSVNIAPGTLSDGGATCSEISFTLTGDDPAIVDYNAKVHGGTFNVALPMIKIVLKNNDLVPYQYSSVRNIGITKTEIKVEVGSPELTTHTQEGLKQLLLSNDFGPLDAAKPFLPFGAQPKKDATLVIGSKEVFSKKNAKIKLHLEWAGLPAAGEIDYDTSADPPYAPDVKLNFLEGGVWKGSTNVTIIPDATALVPIFFSGQGQAISDNGIADYDESYDVYDSSSKKGFLRFVLNGTFKHKEYQAALTEHLIKKATDKAYTSAAPTEPYSPMLQSVYLSYSAYNTNVLTSTDKNTFDARSVQFFHLYPFGEAEQHTYITKKNNPAQTTFNVKLFPQFTHINTEAATVNSVGEFYIGFENLEAQQSVNVLFQVLEGSSDPLLSKPTDHVNWSYLSNNEWKDLSNQEISDATDQLIQSGIITFKIPAGATTGNTMLPAGYLWLRACVKEYAAAVCSLLNAHAQAAIVTFTPNNNADDFLDTALTAGSISKFKSPVSSVKKIEQPYSSFGGRVKETNDQYYVRVSERLRHKARAITIWDYEHLVLEAFPQIHKAKCLNHTKYKSGATPGVIEYNEMKPGYVTIITVPNLVNRNDVNPLKPYTNQSVLKEIKDYLQQRISCHVQLEVANPQFEEVRLSFSMKLAEGFTDFTYYREKLQSEIVSFLTPWAYTDQVEVQFGGKIYKSSLINFIEERPYVEYITLVQMFHKISDTVPESTDLEEVEASTARSILVSAQSKKHSITEITEGDETVTSDCATHTKA